jgi:hypothetical protein
MLQLDQRLFEALSPGGVRAVVDALGAAIQLEHSTIPPYLYAIYSLDPAKNGPIAAIVESVVNDEMLHMTLACNVLNALGGAPSIDRPGFIPTYPGHLPGSVQNQLVVGLAPFSVDLVANTFMTIEEPDAPLQFPSALAAPPPTTIGNFYRLIRSKLTELGDGAFSARPRHQIDPALLAQAIVVTNVETAVQAIDTIVEQGEGTSRAPGEVVGDDFAHYYRFAEIVHGKQLIPNPDATPATPPDQRYVYGGRAVPFDPAAVFQVPINPKTATYADGSSAQRLCKTFNYTYTALLRVLHATFNGHPHELTAALGLMMSLKQQAKAMMSGIATGGICAGPSFEYQPLLA